MTARVEPSLVVVVALALVGATSAASVASAAAPLGNVAAPKPAPVALPLSRASIDVPLASLPQGQLLDQDWRGMPAALPAGGKLAGVTFKRSLERYGPRMQVMVQIEETKPKAEAVVIADDPDGNPSAPRPDSLCFDTANVDNHSGATRMVRHGRGGFVTQKLEGDDQPPDHWTGGMTTETQVARSQDGEGNFPLKDRVQLLHIEQLVLGAQGPVLESRDAWVDAQTGGARVRATAQLPLRDLGERAIGVHLYAGRVGDEVVFVATQSRIARHLLGMRKDEGASMSNCGHLSLRLDVRRGMSEMAELETQIQLRDVTPAEADEDKAKAAADEDANDFRNGKARTSPTEPQDTTPITRTRLGRIALSTSWEPSDKGPLVSFSETWANRFHDE